MKKLVLDVDGVILDFSSKYLELAREILKKDLNPNINRYELKEFLQVNDKENELVWNTFNERNYWTSLEPLSGVVNAIKELSKYDIEIFIVSSVEPCNTKSRLENLKKIGLVPKDIFCVGKHHAPKNEVISVIKPFAFVDDRLDHLYKSKEVPHLVWVDQSHNQYVEKFSELSVTVNSLEEWVINYLPTIIKEK